MSPTPPASGHRLQLLAGEDVAAVGQHLRRLDRADADQRQGDAPPLLDRRPDIGVGQQGALGRGRSGDAGGGQQLRLRPGQLGQAGGQVGGVALHGGVAHAAQHLHHPLGRHPLQRVDGIDHAQQRRAPGRDADHLARVQRGLQEMRRGIADAGQDRFLAVLAAFGDDRLGQAEAVAQARLQVDIGAARRVDGDADDGFVLGPLQQARDRGLRDVQPLRDVGLLQPVDIVHLRHPGDQAKLVDAAHREAASIVWLPERLDRKFMHHRLIIQTPAGDGSSGSCASSTDTVTNFLLILRSLCPLDERRAEPLDAVSTHR